MSATDIAAQLPQRPLGRTGHHVGVVGLGGQAAISEPNNEAAACAIIDRAIALGVNYFDTAPRYGRPDRWSERYLGAALEGRRDSVYLASKTHDRSRDGSLRLLGESLEALRTHYLDAWQLHFVSTMRDVEQIFERGGAIEALQLAREQKIVRNLGVAGHADPDVLIECLRRFPFDQILLSINAADPHHLSFRARLLPMAAERGIGIIAMKVTARGRLLQSWRPSPDDLRTDPELQPGTLTMKEALDYALSLPVSTAIIGCDNLSQLEENVALACELRPLDDREMAALVERARPVARQSLFFRAW